MTEEHADYNAGKEASDGTTASYYDLEVWVTCPDTGKEFKATIRAQDIIESKNMNGHRAEAFRAIIRWGDSPHSSIERDCKKVKFYMDGQLNMMEKYGHE